MGTQKSHRTFGTAAAIASVLLGWLLVLPRQAPNSLVLWSYDLLQLVLRTSPLQPPIIVYMDEQAMQDYKQPSGRPWNRAVHARLLDRLTRDGPRVVVIDGTLSESDAAQADAALAGAIARNRRVVLAGDRVPLPGHTGYTLVPPPAQFETNAAGWGTPKVSLDSDRVARRYDAGDDQEPGLAWAAASVAGAVGTRDPGRRLREERWLNYYGAGRPFESTSMTYSNAETMEQGYFSGRAVFIGGKPETLIRGEDTDVWATPFTKWTARFVPGVAVTAVAYNNLMNDDSLRRLAFHFELQIFLLAGVVSGFGFQTRKLSTAVWLALLMIALTLGVAVSMSLFAFLWFSWIIVCFAQVPCALLFRFLARPERVVQEPANRESTPPESLALEIPDHTLIRCIGEGGYGQVWVARNAIGLYHAVKVVYANRFGNDVPYQRAWRGIQKFMPVSRSHEGFVHILHIGRNEAAGYFFYIMEAADDLQLGQQIDPAAYIPKTLAADLKQREAIPPRECLAFTLAIIEAVDRLHRHHLIHRDIKPSNIIFVNGHPKLADIDLVTDLSLSSEVSRIGTDGYMPLEGPGTAAADVFSLGRVVYVALTGKAPGQCPELPTRVTSHPDCALVLALNQIICKACDADLSRRYPSAALMREDLIAVSRRF